MIYEFICDTCSKRRDIKIPTWDIHTKDKHSLGIDQEKLKERLNEPHYCECGGTLRKEFTDLGKPLFAKVDKQRFL